MDSSPLQRGNLAATDCRSVGRSEIPRRYPRPWRSRPRCMCPRQRLLLRPCRSRGTDRGSSDRPRRSHQHRRSRPAPSSHFRRPRCRPEHSRYDPNRRTDRRVQRRTYCPLHKSVGFLNTRSRRSVPTRPLFRCTNRYPRCHIDRRDQSSSVQHSPVNGPHSSGSSRVSSQAPIVSTAAATQASRTSPFYPPDQTRTVLLIANRDAPFDPWPNATAENRRC